jgi:hypothetical protein
LIQIGAATVVAAHLAHVLLRDRLEDFPHRGVERAATDGAACRGLRADTPLRAFSVRLASQARYFSGERCHHPLAAERL